jgi:putative transposase
MIDQAHALPVTRQAELLELSRSNVYYRPQPVPEADLVLMRRIDELHLASPLAGSRMLRDILKLEGFEVGHKHVRTLMDTMGIATLYRKRNSSAPHPAHRIYPYLLKWLTIERPNHVWATDLTYIPMKRGFVYVVAILDWATRKVVAHRVSTSMTPDFCVNALEEAIAQYGTPDIFNTD